MPENKSEYATHCQKCAAVDHADYEAERDALRYQSAKLAATWSAYWFLDSWNARFGTYEIEPWA